MSYLQTSPEIYHEHRAGCRCVCGRHLPTATLTQTPPAGRLCQRCVTVRAAQERAGEKLRRADDER